MNRLMALLACMLVAMPLVTGCGQPQESDEPMTGIGSEPLWVAKGIRAFPDLEGEAIGGVGVAEAKMVPNVSLRRTVAQKRGREAVAATLRELVQSVYKDYSEAAFTPSMDEGEAQQLVSQVQKSVVDEVLYNCELYDSWRDPQSGDYYALMVLGTDGLAERLRNKMIALEKDRLRIDAAQAHEELDMIIEKNREAATEGRLLP
jgi:hypothetical protein